METDISTDPIYTEAEVFCDLDTIPPVLKQITGCCSAICLVDNVSSICNFCLKKEKEKPMERLVLSPQSMIDCAGWSWDEDGASYKACAKHARDEGVFKATVYPFRGIQDDCRKVEGTKVKINGLRMVMGGKREVLEILKNHPLLGIIEYHSMSLEYISGRRAWDVFTQNPLRAPSVKEKDLESHAVLIVGYGEKHGVPYYVVKNSWGINWGVQGFGRIACDLFDEPFYYPACPFHLIKVSK